jgi:hypothetical protein
MRHNSKLTRWIPATLAGLALAGSTGLNVTALADTTNQVYLITFESTDTAGRPNYTYPYYYSWGYADPAPTGYNVLDTSFMDAPDYTNTVLQFLFDNTMFPPLPSDGGYGVGFGGSLPWTTDATALTSTNRADYIVEFDARVEGLSGATPGNGEFQVRFDAPDDTIQPLDSNADKDTVLQVNIGFQATADWKHYTYTLDQGTVATGSDKLFAQYLAQIDEARFGCNWNLPDGAFGFDSDNTIFMDNIKLSVVSRTFVPIAPLVGYPILDWNFDDKPVWSSWAGGGWSANGVAATYTVSSSDNALGVEGGNAYVMGMDNSAFTDNAPAWAGGNTGGNGPGNYARLDSTEMNDYLISFDARVEGLAPDKLTTGAALQLFLIAPDGTLGETNGATDQLMRLDYSILDLETNWQRISFRLAKGTVNADQGSKTNFPSFYSKISEITFQFQILNSGSAADWGFDGDNRLIIDNFKVERMVVANPALTVKLGSNNDIIVTWEQPSSGTCTLQSAQNLMGPYADVDPAPTSPYNIPQASAPKFFRTLWNPPTQ